MPLSALDWHERYRQQARWTRDLRRYLFERAGLESVQRVLEVGCGTGAVLSDLSESVSLPVISHGLDLDGGVLSLAARSAPGCPLVLGDGQALPYASASFDLTCCHFLLLWVHDPWMVVREMLRVTRPGGRVLALAEPDYGGRIDYPDSLAMLGELQTQALIRQGADPWIGRKLRGIFHQAGLIEVEDGVMGGEWKGKPSGEDLDGEWNTLINDLEGQTEGDVLDTYREEDRLAWEREERVLFVPTFYASGRIADLQSPQ